MQEKKYGVEKLPENILTEAKKKQQQQNFTKDVLKSYTLFCQTNSSLPEHTAFNSPKYDCQGLLNLCVRLVQSRKLLHQCITKKNEIHFLLKSKDQLY